MPLDFITATDFYKVDHRRQYPKDTQFVYSNFTARKSRIGTDWTVFFGLQYALQRYLTELANETFFFRPKRKVLDDYKRLLDTSLGPNGIGVEHIGVLHDFQCIPLEFCALPEGTKVPFKIPMFTLENTHPDFFWVTNYVETLLSSVLWLPCTSASTAARYRAIFDKWAERTGGSKDFVPWQGHDFSFRGMASPEAAAISGAGHLLSFTGTDTIPAIRLLEDYYGGEGLIGGSVPATEHSVMCAGGQGDEIETFRRLLKLYPEGVLSVVSDTWDLWRVVNEILPKLKNEIMARKGKLVIRPDSGDPVKILTGDPAALTRYEQLGLVRCLGDLFGTKRNDANYLELDPHIGAIYGDSITEARASQICENLAKKYGYASTNVVLGIGSYTYQYVTRDTNGFAIKATWAEIDYREHKLFKDPKTDSGEKKSAKGRLAVIRGEKGLELIDDLSMDLYYEYRMMNVLKPVWSNGHFTTRTTLADVRKRIAK